MSGGRPREITVVVSSRTRPGRAVADAVDVALWPVRMRLLSMTMQIRDRLGEPGRDGGN